jgi:hypothetical protein
MDRVEQWLMAMMINWLLPGAAWAQERYYEWSRGMHPMWWGAWGFGMMLMMLLLWGLVIVGLGNRYTLALWSGQEIALRFGLRDSAAAICAWRD